MKESVKSFDENIKIVLYIFVESFMKLIHIMDLLKIFRMQEPVPKDLLSKSPEVGKYREVVQEKDVLLRNSNARIRELEQQVSELEAKNVFIEVQANPKVSSSLIKEYELFYAKIMTESHEIVQQKNQMQHQLKEMEVFCRDIMERYEKAKKVIEQYEETHDNLKKQLEEYQEIINSLTNEYNSLKDYVQNKAGQTDSKSSFKGKPKAVLIKNKLQKQYSQSMFEPLKGLDK